MEQNIHGDEAEAPSRRYCFLLPDLSRPTGGQAVLYCIAAALQEAGHDVALVHAGAHHRYPFADVSGEVSHLPALARYAEPNKPRDRLRRSKARLRERLSNPKTPRFRATSRDVFLLPDFCYQNYARLFPDNPQVLVAQDPTALFRAYDRDTDNLHRGLASVLSCSDVATNAVRVLLGRQSHRWTQSVARPGLRADHPKKLQIAYMPRKLRTQSQRVAKALQRRPALADVPVVAIDNMSNEERDQVLNESLIFLSFSNMEGFGLPPAEAMAAGCLVIGYTGVGGNEFFTSETGFVIEQNDTPRFLTQVEEVVTAYRRDPAPLDRLRAGAADTIATRYSAAQARQSLLDAWEGVQSDLQTRA